MHLMQYVGNADSADKSGAVLDANNEQVLKGSLGEFTDQQVAVLSGIGIILVAIDDGGLADMSASDLKKRAEKEGVDSSLNKDELVTALRENFKNSGKVRASLAIGGEPLTAASTQPAAAQSSTVGAPPTSGTGSGSAT